MFNPESFGPVDPLQGHDGIGGDTSSPPATPQSAPPAGDAIFESVARRNQELEEEDVVEEKRSFLDVGLKFYSDLRNRKDNE